MDDVTRVCTKCFTEKPIEEFGWKIDRKVKGMLFANLVRQSGLLIGTIKTKIDKRKMLKITIKHIGKTLEIMFGITFQATRVPNVAKLTPSF